MSKTFKELEQVNYESALFALAHGVDYEQLGDIMDEALEVEELIDLSQYHKECTI